MPPRRANFSGKLSGADGASQQPASSPALSSAGDRPPLSSTSSSSTALSQVGNGASTPSSAAQELEPLETEVCFICAEDIKFYSVGVCDHRTCHVCALRLRALYKKKECTYCKTECPDLIFTDSATTPYDQLPRTAFTDDRLNIMFENGDMMEDALLLLRFNCPSTTCDYIASGWPDLRLHVRVDHTAELCQLCIRQKKIFSHEHELYPPLLLPHHLPSSMKRGQRAPPLPRGMEITNEMGVHPLCHFCHECFFAEDELYQHMKKDHEDCFICKRNGVRDLYFQNYQQLEAHFRSEHHPCYSPACLEKKFVVFTSDLDLKVHQVEEHASQMSARDLALARRIQVQMSFEEPSHPAPPSARGGSSRGGRGGSTRGGAGGMRGGRDAAPHQPAHSGSAASQANARSDQNQARDSGGGNSRRAAFGGGLTGGEGDAGSSGQGRSLVGHGGENGATPEEVDRHTMDRHAALLSRVSILVNHSEARLATFRSVVAAFRSGQNGTRDVIDTIYNILNREVEPTISVLKGVTDLLTGMDPERKQGLMKAISDWAAERRNEFPTLQPLTNQPNYSGIAGGRVINVKKNTPSHSSRVWSAVEQAASSSSRQPNRTVPSAGPSNFNGTYPSTQPVNKFPALGDGVAFKREKSKAAAPNRHVPGSTAWAQSQSSSGSSSPYPSLNAPQSFPSLNSKPSKPTPVSVNYASTSTSSSSSKAGGRAPKPPSEAAFPSLAPSTKAQQEAAERRALFAKPSARQESIQRLNGGKPAPQSAVWGSGVYEGGSSGASSSAGGGGNGSDGQGGLGGGGKKKGKGKGKELLFQISARPN